MDAITPPDLAKSELTELMLSMGRAARDAAAQLAHAPTSAKNAALHAMAKALRGEAKAILTANEADIRAARDAGRTEAFVDRLVLTQARIDGIAAGLDDIAALDDPVGTIIAAWDRPNGLRISRVRTPLGVIGVIYESRPNVTADAGALCLKSGNAAILRGGSESRLSAAAIHAALVRGLREASLPETAIQLVPTTDRDAVGHMLSGLDGSIDVIVPRGGKSLVARVEREARVPVFAHLDGNCHVYVHKAADKEMAADIVLNSKMRRVSVCGAAETLLIDKDVAQSHLPLIAAKLRDAGCVLRGDAAARRIDPDMAPASEEDWATEYLDAILAVRVVDDIKAAIDHVETHGSHHTDAIVTDDADAAERFLSRVDSAIVLHNASTQYADGGEFGMGGEIGIATGRMHARGPVGLEQLTSFKYMVRGGGQVRP